MVYLHGICVLQLIVWKCAERIDNFKKMVEIRLFLKLHASEMLKCGLDVLENIEEIRNLPESSS